MGDTPKCNNVRSLRSKVDHTSCFPLNLTSDYVFDFAVRLDTQVKKCLETTNRQDITDLVPIIVETLTSLDQYTNDLLECQKKRDSLQENLKTKNLTLKQLKQQFDVECKAHQDTILDSDTQILELTEEKRVVEEEYKTLKKKINTDRVNIDMVNKRIGKLTTETNEVTNSNVKLKESIQHLRTRLNHLQLKASKNALSKNQSVPNGNHGPSISCINISQPDPNSQDINIQPNPTIPARTIHLLGDSNVRGIGTLMCKNSGNSTVKVLTSCIPGGGLCQLNDAFIQHPVPGDIIIIHAGTNDICSTEWTNIKRSLGALITKYLQCNIIVFTVPPRGDYLYLNKHINKFNTLLKYEFEQYKNVHLVPTKRLLKTNHIKADGVHYNQQGREKIAKKMMSFQYLPILSRDYPPILSPTMIGEPVPATIPTLVQDVLIAESLPPTSPTQHVSPPNSLHILTPLHLTPNPAPTTHPSLLEELGDTSFF
uniref:Uncharacterized protein n=1 Tax=Cacopsylla melanoneura TaxID=428564 RepID=A0A8D8Z9V0_9HEMI